MAKDKKLRNEQRAQVVLLMESLELAYNTALSLINNSTTTRDGIAALELDLGLIVRMVEDLHEIRVIDAESCFQPVEYEVVDDDSDKGFHLEYEWDETADEECQCSTCAEARTSEDTSGDSEDNTSDAIDVTNVIPPKKYLH